MKTIFFNLLLVGFSINCFAQSICVKEQSEFCADQKEPAQVLKCLANYRDKLSVHCKQELERMLQMREEAGARGGGSLAAFGGLNAMGSPLPLFSYEARWSPGERGADLNEHKGNVSMPVYRNQTDVLALSLAGSQLHLGETLRLTSGREAPSTLTRYELGAQFSKKLEEKRSWGLRGSIGYAGDQPSSPGKDSTYSLIANYGYPGEKGYWSLFGYMSNNSPILNYFPLPGVAYFYKSQNFTGVFGFPILSMQWTPVNPWAYSVSLFGPTFQMEASYGHRDDLQFFVNYGFSIQSYIPSEREQKKERLYFREQKLVAGVRTLIFKKTMLELQAGRVMDRSLYMGKSFLKRDTNFASLPDDWFMNLALKVLLF